jgi:dephospho-CoA kinase
MLKIGLTGGIGSGKSVVAEIFSVLGIPVFDADREAKKIMNEDAGLRKALITEFGEEAYTTAGLNRSFIAAIVFKDESKLAKLNAIVHPVTIAAANNWMNIQTSPYIIKEAALMFEAGSALHLDHIIGVSAPEAIAHTKSNATRKCFRRNCSSAHEQPDG